MKNKKHIVIGALLIAVLLIVIAVTFCSRQDEDSPDISPKGQKEHDVILENEDLEEEYHVIDEYIEADKDGDSKDDNKTSDGGNQTSNNNNTAGNSSTGNAGVADDGESDDDIENGEDNTGNGDTGKDENTEDNEEETPSTNLQPSEDKNGDWGKIEF